MANDDSVAGLLVGVRNGNDDGARRLWDRYFQRLVRLAGSRLPGHARRAGDGEDIALSAIWTFCDRARRDNFPALSGGDDLWRLLSTIVAHKAADSIRRHARQKRGGGRVLSESALMDDRGGGIEALCGGGHGPEADVELADACERLFDRLGDPALRAVATGRLEGRSSEEIAAELGVSVRTVDRKLQLIRAVWQEAYAC
jgi:DNA-directed RNA polymerase specialized sigma24 family protein